MKVMQGVALFLAVLLCVAPYCVSGHFSGSVGQPMITQNTNGLLEQGGEASVVSGQSSVKNPSSFSTVSSVSVNQTDCVLHSSQPTEGFGEETVTQFAAQTGQYDTVYPVTLGGIGEDVIGFNGVITLSQTHALLVNLPPLTEGAHQIWVRAEQDIEFSGTNLYFGTGGVDTVLLQCYNGTAWDSVKTLSNCRFEAGEAIPLLLKINGEGILTAAGFLAAPSPNGYTAADIPSYWKGELQRGARDITRALSNAGEEKAAFLFYTDAHWNYGSQMSPKLLTYLQHHTLLSQTTFGGDIVNDEGDDEATMAYLWDWREQLSALTHHHSVTGNHDDGSTVDNRFTKEYVYHYLLAPERTEDLVYGDGLFYYRDNPAEKTRYFYLDTAFLGVTPSQKEFVKQGLLSTPENWHIVVFSHVFYDPDYSQYEVRPIPIVGLSGQAKVITDMLDRYNARQGEFEGAKAKVEFCMGGHCHRDYLGKTDGGIPIVLMETDSRHIRSEFFYTAQTTDESSVNGVIADYTAGTLTVIRVGRGNSRVIDLTTATQQVLEQTPLPEQLPEPPKEYPNLLTQAGILENTRISCSTGELREQAGVYTTGMIPVPDGYDVIVHLQGITMPDVNEPNQNNVSCYDANGNFISGTAYPRHSGIQGLYTRWDEQGNLTQFIVGHSNVAYIRISGMYMDENSKVWIE